MTGWLSARIARRPVPPSVFAAARTLGPLAVAPLIAGVSLAIPGLTLPPNLGWQPRLLVLTGTLTAVLASARRTAPPVTATAIQILAVTALGVLARRPPHSLALAAAGALLLAGYLLASDLSMLRWPRSTLLSRIWPGVLAVLGGTGAVAGASVLPTVASPVAILAGLAGMVAGYALAARRRPRPVAAPTEQTDYSL